MNHPAYALAMPPAPATPVLFATPHAGRDYPSGFLRDSQLDGLAIRSSEDAFVDLLFDMAPEMGAPLLVARTPRAFVDVNRAAEELDPALIDGVRAPAHNPRVASGLGVIPRVVANGRAIRRGKISLTEARGRLDGHWHPYHRMLRDLMDAQRVRFGEAILIDCHSMPHEAIEAQVTGQRGRADVILGDRFGASAAPQVVERVEAAFAAAGFRVARNAPFAGAYIAQHYGRPVRGQHVVQVEIDRALYMDERRIRPHSGFTSLRRRLAGVVEEIAAIGRQEMPMAAE